MPSEKMDLKARIPATYLDLLGSSRYIRICIGVTELPQLHRVQERCQIDLGRFPLVSITKPMRGALMNPSV